MVRTLMEKIREKQIVPREFLNKWFKYYLIFHEAAPLICDLIIVNASVEKAVVEILITHLTDNNWLSLPKAASIVNVQDGLTAYLVTFVAYASDAHWGSFWTVVYTTIAYISGLLLMFFAAWRLQSIEMKLLYMAVLLVAFGRAGRDIPLKEFLADQFIKDGSAELDERQVESGRKVWWRSASFVGNFVSVYFLTDASWIKLSKISAIAMGAAFVLFLEGIAFYERKKPNKNSSNMSVLRVVYAAVSKRHFSNTPPDNDHIVDIPKLRWSDKVAIVESSPSLEEQVKKGRLYTVEQVQKVRILFAMVPLWTTFLVYGLVQATGNTFFYEQTNYVDDHLGKISHVPIVIFVIIMTSTSFAVPRFCEKLFLFYWGEKVPRHVMLARLGIGMAISPICCVVAWRVENYRLQQYVKLDTSISVFWLIPQFFLLGLMEGLVFDGLEEFFYTQVPKAFKDYGPPITQFALNIGNFLGLVFIFVFHGLFGDTLDTSSLATYYAMLGYTCFVNFLFYCCVAAYYVKDEEPHDEEIEQEQAGKQPQNSEDNPESMD